MSDFFRDELSTVNNELVQRQYTLEDNNNIPASSFRNELSPKNQTSTTNIDLSELRPGMLLRINGQTLQDVYIASLRDVDGALAPPTVYLSRNFTGTEYGLPVLNPDNTPFTYNTYSFVGYVKDKIIGSYDNRNKNYVISIQKNIFTTNSTQQSVIFKTLAFEEDVKGWVSFYNYMPTDMFSIQNNFFTVNKGDLYQHYDESVSNGRGEFYGVKYPATVEFVFNDNPQVSKNFQTINYEGNSGWEVEFMISDQNGQVRYSPGGSWFVTRDTINAIYTGISIYLNISV